MLGNNAMSQAAQQVGRPYGLGGAFPEPQCQTAVALTADGITAALRTLHERMAATRDSLEAMARSLGVPHLPQDVVNVSKAAGEPDDWCAYMASLLEHLSDMQASIEYNVARLRHFV